MSTAPARPTEPDLREALAQSEQHVAFLLRDNKRMRRAGLTLAEAAIHVIREFDGVHRLSLAVSEWTKAVADEGDRAARAALSQGEPHAADT